MKQYIDKAAAIAEIKKLETALRNACKPNLFGSIEECVTAAELEALDVVKRTINTLKVIDPYEQFIQYPSIKDGIEAHAETYSFNIESELFHQLTKKQQKLWRKEIEQACISGGEMGVELARDTRYKVKEMESVWNNARTTIPEDCTEQIICIKEDGLALVTIGKIVNNTIKWAYLNDLKE